MCQAIRWLCATSIYAQVAFSALATDMSIHFTKKQFSIQFFSVTNITE